MPEFDDSDTFETITVVGSITNYFNNPGSYNAYPDLTGSAYNRYDLDVNFERNNLFIESEITCLTDKDNSNRITTASELDKDISIGYTNGTIDIYLEYVDARPTNHTLIRAYTGVADRYNYSSDIINFIISAEKVISNRQYNSRPDGSGETNMIYRTHLDIDLQGKFSFSTEQIIYTDKHKYLKGSEWDRLFQINYQASDDVILLLYKEVDKFIDVDLPAQAFLGVGLLYEF